ncbi:MAG: lysylphosphatidylglycerol synthase transmembrane domain-containing protein [Candidatus Zixiibacteriota bacterium]
MQKKKLLSVILGIIISIAFLFIIFRNVNIAELAGVLKNANYWWLLPNLFFVIFAMYQRAERWKFMVKPIASIPYGKLLSATCIGFMANNILPFRLGEFVRAYSLSYKEKKITKSASLATIFIERMVFDLLALLLILGVIIWFIPTKFDDTFKLGAALSLGIAIFGLLFAIIIVMKPEGSGRLLARYLFFLPEKVREYINSTVIKFSKGLLFLKDWRLTLSVTGHTIFLWLCMGISNIFVFYAFGFDLPIYASYVLLVVVSISILIPSAPGFIGVYHAGVVWTLHYFNVDSTHAASCALVLHAAQFIPITLLGFYYVWKEGMSLKQLRDESTKSSDESEL